MERHQDARQSACRSLYWDSAKKAQVNGVAMGGSGGPAYQQGRLAQFGPLSRLTGF